ncbi:MAG: cysteine dioxygenase [Candidatus Krumholzibacteriia bacterium]
MPRGCRPSCYSGAEDLTRNPTRVMERGCVVGHLGTFDPAGAALIRRLEEAVSVPDTSSICRSVKNVLQEKLNRPRDFVPQECLRADPARYARRLLFKDPDGRFSVVVMVWAPGQQTPLHDHAGHWCVECVYEGRIRVTSFDLEEERNGDALFKVQTSVVSGMGEAGALIPPSEYHTIANPFDEKAVTLHVYRGEITWCHAFEPLAQAGWYRRQRRALPYTV